MKIQHRDFFSNDRRNLVSLSAVLAASAVYFALTSVSHAGTNWDAGSGTQWWFDPVNWSTNLLPPANTAMPVATTDTDIILSTDTLPGGEGVVFDPSNNDPNFANAINLVSTQPAGFGPQFSGSTYTGYNIQQLYVGRAQGGSLPVNSKVTIKGSLTSMNNIIIGRSSGTRDVGVNAAIVQTAGLLSTTGNFDIAQTDPPGQSGYGNGTYDYRGGSLLVTGTNGIRLVGGSNTLITADNLPAGGGGIGKIIMHNPATPGYVRANTLVLGSYAGVPASIDSGLTNADPNGVTKGVSILEYHFENGGVRPIQVGGVFTLNNGRTNPGATPATTDTNGTRSTRLNLALDAAPTLTAGVPQNLALVDVDWTTTDFFVGSVTGSGDLNGNGDYGDDKFFSDANAANPLLDSATLRQDSIVSAVFGSTKYNWKISYTGLITYQGADEAAQAVSADSSLIASIAHDGGLDVVLMGFSTEVVTPPGVEGDYNNNGIVDAADYTVWRDHLGQSFALPHEGSGVTTGSVTIEDYNFWKAHFGASGSGSLSGSAVPEPASAAIAMLGLVGMFAFRRRTA